MEPRTEEKRENTRRLGKIIAAGTIRACTPKDVTAMRKFNLKDYGLFGWLLCRLGFHRVGIENGQAPYCSRCGKGPYL